jgi:hypothetical protein
MRASSLCDELGSARAMMPDDSDTERKLKGEVDIRR